MSQDNRFMAIVETLKSSLPERKKGDNWDFFALTCKAKPHCRIVYVDLQTGSSHTVLEDDCWFGMPRSVRGIRIPSCSAMRAPMI